MLDERASPPKGLVVISDETVAQRPIAGLAPLVISRDLVFPVPRQRRAIDQLKKQGK
jgi:hypothetical protein